MTLCRKINFGTEFAYNDNKHNQLKIRYEKEWQY